MTPPLLSPDGQGAKFFHAGKGFHFPVERLGNGRSVLGRVASTNPGGDENGSSRPAARSSISVPSVSSCKQTSELGFNTMTAAASFLVDRAARFPQP